MKLRIINRFWSAPAITAIDFGETANMDITDQLCLLNGCMIIVKVIARNKHKFLYIHCILLSLFYQEVCSLVRCSNVVISLFVLEDSVVSASFCLGSICSGLAIVQRGVDTFLEIVSAILMLAYNVIGPFKLGMSFD